MKKQITILSILTLIAATANASEYLSWGFGAARIIASYAIQPAAYIGKTALYYAGKSVEKASPFNDSYFQAGSAITLGSLTLKIIPGLPKAVKLDVRTIGLFGACTALYGMYLKLNESSHKLDTLNLKVDKLQNTADKGFAATAQDLGDINKVLQLIQDKSVTKTFLRECLAAALEKVLQKNGQALQDNNQVLIEAIAQRLGK